MCVWMNTTIPGNRSINPHPYTPSLLFLQVQVTFCLISCLREKNVICACLSDTSGRTNKITKDSSSVQHAWLPLRQHARRKKLAEVGAMQAVYISHLRYSSVQQHPTQPHNAGPEVALLGGQQRSSCWGQQFGFVSQKCPHFFCCP